MRANGQETQSLCPVCLDRIPAVRVRKGDAVFLQKDCPAHGRFSAVIWRDPPEFESWRRPKIPTSPRKALCDMAQGCPFDCGPCAEHRQHTCTALLEVTARCNLNCPVCFAASPGSKGPDPDWETIRFWYQQVAEVGGPCNIQLSGGEPTVREDLPWIIQMGQEAGFSFIQLNTNGLRLASGPDYARQLKEAGLDSVFLQFDGVSDAVYQRLRGSALMAAKAKAVTHCVENGIGVVLVPTLIPGVNVSEVGAILDWAVKHAPGVRGVHFQPISFFGRYPRPPQDQDRLTLPELIMAIANQTGGRMQAENFRPPGCENARCSFHGNFMVMPGGALRPLAQGCCASPEPAAEGARQTISTVARQWAGPEARASGPCDCQSGETDELTRFLLRAKTHTFSVSAMAFQDVWTLDLERLHDCCIHVVSPDGRLIPFCAYNLTSASGRPLYRRP